MAERDVSSLSNSHEVRVTHLDWKVNVDFESCTLSAVATYSLPDTTAKHLDLDTAHLLIQSVVDQDDQPLVYKLHAPSKPHLGRKLSIRMTEGTTSVSIAYSTTDQCSAIQWLPPSQTSGGFYPYLFTQCQAIHARSLVPCQDLPGVKMTYTAEVTVPSWAVCVMSAVVSSSSQQGATKVYTWRQAVPISSYLLAMAVGDLARRDLSNRCAVWSEPSIVEAAAYEFAQTEEFLSLAESIAGTPYIWGRYDLLCLPPSCPYGGMENPCLTFVTPTLLAGDRSLADVVAHEIAHSWTGNLVTNRTWDHFWLNEGWTTWFQRKIMAQIHSDAFLDFDALGGLKTLSDTIHGKMPAAFTRLVLPIGDKDPDEAYSSVAYEKGFNFLMYLERQIVGREAFEAFFKVYIKTHINETLTSKEFQAFFLQYFAGHPKVGDIDWETWFYGEGMPPVVVDYDKTLAEASENLAQIWYAVDRNGRMLPTQDISSWSSAQLTCFLDELQMMTQWDGGKPLHLATLAAMNKLYGFARSKNAEILFRFCQLSVEAEDESILPVVLHFITGQGRMKFVRPLYRALFKSKMGREIATSTFLENQDFYHPICAKMIASDLAMGKKNGKILKVVGLTVLAAGLAGIGFVILRRRRH